MHTLVMLFFFFKCLKDGTSVCNKIMLWTKLWSEGKLVRCVLERCDKVPDFTDMCLKRGSLEHYQ